MTESEARTKPISEVWEHFKSADENYPRTKHIRDRLRAVLLERCKSISDESGITTIAYFGLTMEDDYSFSEKEMVCIHANDWCGQSDQLMNLAAACSFWAWELKQRQNESNG